MAEMEEGGQAGWRRDEDGGRRAAVLGHGGDAIWWALGCRGERRGGAAKCSHSTTEQKRSSVESLLENGTEASECWRGYDCWAVELVSRPANESVQTIRHPQHNISEKFNKLFQ